jgi:quinol monooxygenase YgiN
MPNGELRSSRKGLSIAPLAGRNIRGAKAVIAFFTFLSSLVGIRAAYAQVPSAPLYAVAYIEVASQSQEQAAALLKSWAETVRKNPDNLGFAPLRRLTPTNHFAIVEIWKDAKAFETQSASPEGKQFRSALSPLLIAPYDERPHSVLAVDGERSKAAIEKADKDTVFGVTHVDVIPPKKDEAVVAAKSLHEPASQSGGNLTFDVLQQISRQNHMTLFEAWKSMAGMVANTERDFMKSYRFGLQPMSGSLFDHRIYTILR